MAPRPGSKPLALSVFLAIIFLAACGIFVTLRVVPMLTHCIDYTPRERVLNCFDANEMREPLCVSPEGKQLVAAGFGKVTWVTNWDDRSRTTTVVQDLDFGERVEAAAFSGDGRQLAFYARSPAQDVIAVFDARTREVLKKWPAPRSNYQPRLRLSHDGAVLCTNPVEPVNRLELLEAITVWDTSTGKLVSSILTPKGSYLVDFEFSRGRMMLAYERLPDYKEISIYESAPPYAQTTLVSSIKAPGATVFGDVRFSADGTRLAVASHHAQPMKVYEVSDGHLIAELGKAYYGVISDGFPGFTFSPNGTILAVSNSGGTVSLWSVGSTKELCTLQGRRYEGMHDLVFGPGGKTLISRDSYAVVLWDIRDFVDQDH